MTDHTIDIWAEVCFRISTNTNFSTGNAQNALQYVTFAIF